MLTGLILILLGKYGSFIARLAIRFSGHSVIHRAMNKILHLLCPDWLVRWMAALTVRRSGSIEELKQRALYEVQKAVELMPDETLNEIVASIREGTISEQLDMVFARRPYLAQMGITEVEFLEVFQTEKFLRDHRERHKEAL